MPDDRELEEPEDNTPEPEEDEKPTTQAREPEPEEELEQEPDPLANAMEGHEPAGLTKKPKSIFGNPFGEPPQRAAAPPAQPMNALAREQTPEFKIQSRNPGLLDDWESDPAQRDMMALTKAFAGMGESAKNAYRGADKAGKEKLLKALVGRVAAQEWEGYQGKDDAKRRKESAERLMGATIGLNGLVEFGAKSKEEIEADKQKKADADKGLLAGAGYVGAQFGRGVTDFFGGVLKSIGLGTDSMVEADLARVQGVMLDKFAKGDPDKIAQVNAEIDKMRGGLGIGQRNPASIAGDYLRGAASRTPGKHDAFGDTLATSDQLRNEDALDKAIQNSGAASLDSARVMMSHPGLFVSKGSYLLGMMVGPGGTAKGITSLGQVSLMKMGNAIFAEQLKNAAAKIPTRSSPTMIAGFAGTAVQGTGDIIDHMDMDDLRKTAGFQDRWWQMRQERNGFVNEDEVRSDLKQRFQREDLPRQALFQALFLSLGAHPAQALSGGVGARVLSTLTQGGPIKSGLVMGAGGGAQAMAQTASSQATVQSGLDGKPYMPTFVDKLASKESIDAGLEGLLFGAPLGMIHGAGYKPPAKPGAPEPPKLGSPSMVGRIGPPELGEAAKAKAAEDAAGADLQNRHVDMALGRDRDSWVENLAHQYPDAGIDATTQDMESRDLLNDRFNRKPPPPGDGGSPAADFKSGWEPLPEDERRFGPMPTDAVVGKRLHGDPDVDEAHKRTARDMEKATEADFYDTAEDPATLEAALERGWGRGDKAAQPEEAKWASKDGDFKVRLSDDPPEPGPDGRMYQKVDAVKRGRKWDETPALLPVDELTSPRFASPTPGPVSVGTPEAPITAKVQTQKMSAFSQRAKAEIDATDRTASYETEVATVQREKLPEVIARNYGQAGSDAVDKLVRKRGTAWSYRDTEAAKLRVMEATAALARPNELSYEESQAHRAVVDADQIMQAAKDAPAATEADTNPPKKYSLLSAEDRAHIDAKGHISPVDLDGVARKAEADFQRVGLRVVKFNTEEEMQAALGDTRTGVRATYGVGLDKKPTVYLVMKNLRDAKDARNVVEQEVIGHHAIEDMLGDRMVGLRLTVSDAAARDPKGIGSMLDGVKRDYPEGLGFTPEEQYNELISRVAHYEGDLTRSMRNVLYTVRNLLTSLSFESPGPMRLRDLQQLLRDVSYSYRRSDDPADVSRFRSKGYAFVDQRVNRVNENVVMQPTKLGTMGRLFSDSKTALYNAMTVMTRTGGNKLDAEVQLRKMDSDKAREQDFIAKTLQKPVEMSIARLSEKAGLTPDEGRELFDQYVTSKHIPEVNEWHRLVHSPLKDDALTEEREAVVTGAMKGDLTPKEARDWLDQNITDDKVKNPETWAKDNVRRGGMANDEAAAVTDAIRNKLGGEHFAEMERINKEELKRYRDHALSLNVRSGFYNPILTEMMGFDNYIPRKGTDNKRVTDQRIAHPRMETELSDFTERQVATKGRADMSRHGLTQMFMDGYAAANRSVNNEFLTTLLRNVNEHNARIGEEGTNERPFAAVGQLTAGGKVVPSTTPDKIFYDGNKFMYAKRPDKTDIRHVQVFKPEADEHGEAGHYTMELKDQAVAEAMSSSKFLKPDLDLGSVNSFINASTRVGTRSYAGFNPFFWTSMIRRDVPQAFWVAGAETSGHAVETALREQETTLGRRMTRAERTEFHKTQGSDYIQVNAKAVADAGKGMYHVLTSGDARKFMMAAPGARKMMMDAWRDGNHADLEKMYKDDPEGLAAGVKARDRLREFAEQGGLVEFSAAYDASTEARVDGDPLANASGWRKGLETAKDFLGHKSETIVQWIDNGRRFGLYSALREAGVDPRQAALSARTLQDFNARGAWLDGNAHWTGKYARMALPFSNANLQGIVGQFERNIWRGGKPPLEPRLNADGTTTLALSPDWHKSLNWPLMLAQAGKGAAAVYLYSMFEGKDENGEDNARKHAPGTWFGAGQGGMQYGMYRFFGALGTATALKTLGYHEDHELLGELFSESREQLAPIGSMRAPEGEHMGDIKEWGKQFLTGFAPWIGAPAMQAVLNRDAFGGNITQEGTPIPLRKYSGPDMWKGVADTLGGDPKIWRHFAKNYAYAIPGGTPLVQAADRLGVTAKHEGSWMDYARSLPTPARLAGGPDWSVDSWEAREAMKVNTGYIKPMVDDLRVARELDQRSDPSLGRGSRRSIGPREQALYDAHPDLKDQLSVNGAYRKQMGVLGRQAVEAKAAGDDDTAHDLKLQMKSLQYKYVRAFRDKDYGSFQGGAGARPFDGRSNLGGPKDDLANDPWQATVTPADNKTYKLPETEEEAHGKPETSVEKNPWQTEVTPAKSEERVPPIQGDDALLQKTRDMIKDVNGAAASTEALLSQQSPSKLGGPKDVPENDAPSQQEQFVMGLARKMAARTNSGVDGVIASIKDVFNTIKRWEQDPTLPSSRGDTDIGKDAVALGPGMLLPGFGRAVGGLGAAGGTPPKITALVGSLKGKPAFEELADQIYAKLKDVRKDTVTPAAYELNAGGVLKHDSPEGLALSRLQRQTDAERLGEVAEHAAAWQFYRKSLGTSDFELGAMGGAGKQRANISEAAIAERDALIAKHPQYADQIRESYKDIVATGEPVAQGLPSISAKPEGEGVRYKGQFPRLPNEQLPTQPPGPRGDAYGQSMRALDEGSLKEAREMLAQGKTQAEVADHLGVAKSTLKLRLSQPYAARSTEDVLARRPGASSLRNDEVQSLILSERRAGKSYPDIAERLSNEVFKGQRRVKPSEVEDQIRQMRRAEARKTGTGPTPFDERGGK